MFKVGDKVTWSNGGYYHKTGTIVRVLNISEFKRGINPCRIAMNEFPSHKRMFDGWKMPGGANTGYLVEVITGKNAKPRLYMPYPSKLKATKEV